MQHQQEPGYWLFFVQRSVAYAFSEMLRQQCQELGRSPITPPQWTVLTILARQDGLPIGVLSQQCGTDAPTATGIVQRLEKSGLIERVHALDDRRIVRVQITDEGQTLFKALTGPVAAFDEMMIRGFSQEERNAFVAGLRHIFDNIAQGVPGLEERFGTLPGPFLQQYALETAPGFPLEQAVEEESR